MTDTAEQQEGASVATQARATGPFWTRLQTFSSLKNRDFRWLWIGYLFSFAAIMMQMVARGWLVYDLSASAFYLSLVWSMFGIAVLVFSPIGGVVADRVDKRNLLLVTQIGVAAVSVVVAILIQFDMIELWHLMAASLASGAIFSFNMPARQAFITELVGESELMNGIALSTAAMNLMRIAGPAIAGVLVEVIGIAGVYWVIVASYVFVIGSILKIPSHGVSQKTVKSRLGFFAQLMEGVNHVWEKKELVGLLVIAFVAVLFGWNYQAFMPAIAVDILKTGPSGFGILMAFSGVGAVVGTLGVATLGDYKRKGALMVLMALMFGVTLTLFAVSRNYYLSLLLVALVGLTSMAFMTINQTLVQVIAEPEKRGRVVSLLMMTWGLQPLGALPFGFLADRTSIAFTLALTGILLTATIPLMLVRSRAMLRL